MKFLCPNCKAKYRIGAEKLVGRQAAKIRCRKCDYRIQIARKPGGEGYEVTATATSVLPSPPGMLNLGAAIRSRGVSEGVDEDVDDDADDVAPLSAPLPARSLPERRPVPAPMPPPPLAPAPLPPPGGRAPMVGRPVPRPFAAAQRPVAGAAAQALESPAAPPAAPLEAPVARPAPPSPAPAPEEATQAVEKAIEEAGAELPKDDWFVGVNGVPLGPIPLADLCELAVAGHVDRRSLVWREGFDEWKPLGKLPELLHVVERVAPQSEAPDKLLSAVVPAALPKMGAPKLPNGMGGSATASMGTASMGTAGGPPPAPSKTANGASVRPAPFGIPRPGAEPTNKPPISSYTPIEDEDDDEEQPTTVKPRPSTIPEAPGPSPTQTLRNMQTTQVRAVPLMPPPPGVGGAPAAPPAHGSGLGAPQPGAVAGLPPAAPAPAFAGSNPFPVVRAPVVEASLPTSISGAPTPLVDEGSDGVLVGPRKSRTKVWILVGAAFVLSVAINAWISSYFSRGDADSSEPSKSPPAQDKASEPASAPPQKATPDQADEGVEIIDGPLPTAPAPRPGGGGSAKPTGQLTPDDAPVKAGVLAGLSRLGEPTVAGPSSGPSPRGTGGGGLDSAAIQQTVGRYKPSVQRGCWQPALSTKAPGAPSSARVSVSLTVDGTGRVTSASTGGDPRGYPGLARCIESRVRGWRFPRSSGTTSVAVPFVFAGQ